MVLKLYVGTKFRENGQKSRKSRNLIPYSMVYSGLFKYNLQEKIHCIFVNVSERVVLLSRHKIDFKIDLIK